ncbi:MAG: diguanylate cyclase [Clostridia bacterium]|nr:diguanylate cyclase [Clostridia bacterium]
MKPQLYGKGIRMKMFNTVMIVLVLIVTVFLLLNIVHTIHDFQAVQDGTEDYMRAQKDASDLQTGSDYLTQQVRAFVVTGDSAYIDLYFEEANHTRSRDQALADIREIVPGHPSLSALDEAMRESTELMNLEIRAMRLMMEAEGADLTQAPAEIQAAALTEEEKALSSAEKRQLAQRMVFDSDYQGYKARISEDVLSCTEALIDTTREYHITASGQLMVKLWRQLMLIVVMLAIMMLTVILSNALVIHPLERNVACVQKDKPMQVNGAWEIRFLAENYNAMFERTRQNQDKLSYEATHDALTGVYNRKAYESALAERQESDIALIIVDVDSFKTFNDSWGHAVGDKVLKRVAQALTDSFRSEDWVCRIGGDEFAVVMMHASSALHDLVLGKCSRIRGSLAAEKDGVPPVTLSIGVAFGDRESPSGTLFQDADKALYDVKRRGRNGCAIYSPEMADMEPPEHT